MNENEQIQEMARIISTACKGIRCSDCETYGNDTSACVDVKSAEAIYNAGYRKVEHGEWIYDAENECFICPKCKSSALNNYRGLSVNSNFCPHCGADMRGDQDAD